MFFKGFVRFVLIRALLLTAGCSGGEQSTQVDTEAKGDEKLSVVTTIPPLYSFVSQIVGDKADVYNLLPAGVSVHTWEPKPSDVKRLVEADVLVMNGLDIEMFLEDLLIAAGNKNLRVVVASEGLEGLIEIEDEDEGEHHDEKEHEEEAHDEHGHEHGHDDHDEGYGDKHKDEHDDHGHEDEHGHHHGGTDPHVWLSLEHARSMVAKIANEVSAADAANKDFYSLNAVRFMERLAKLENSVRMKFAKVDGKGFIVFHDAYGYYFKAFGLEKYRKAALHSFPGKEVSPQYLKKLTDLIEKEGVKVAFSEVQFSPKLLKVLSDDLGLKVYEIDPLGKVEVDGYVNNINALSDAFLKAFEESYGVS